MADPGKKKEGEKGEKGEKGERREEGTRPETREPVTGRTQPEQRKEERVVGGTAGPGAPLREQGSSPQKGSWVGERQESSGEKRGIETTGVQRRGGGERGMGQGGAETLACCGETFASREKYDQHQRQVHGGPEAAEAPVGGV